MKENKFISRCCFLTGTLLILASITRAISINNFVIAASTGDISTQYAPSVIVDWSLSSLLLMLVGVWTFFLSRDLRKLQRRAWLQALLISLSLVVFGAGLWYKYPGSLQLPVYLLMGLILLIPLLFGSGKFDQ